MMDRREYRTRIREVTPELKHKHQMEMLEEAWKLFNWMHNEMKKQDRLNDY